MRRTWPPTLSISLRNTDPYLSLSLPQKKNSSTRLSLSDSLTSLSCSQKPHPSLTPPKIAQSSLPLPDSRLSTCLSLSLTEIQPLFLSLSKKTAFLSLSRLLALAPPSSTVSSLSSSSQPPLPSPRSSKHLPLSISSPINRRAVSSPYVSDWWQTASLTPSLSLSEVQQLPSPPSPHVAPPNAEPPPPPLSRPSSSNHLFLPISSYPRSSRPPP